MKKDDAFYLRFCYAAFGLMIFYICSKSLEAVGMHTGWSERFYEWYPVASTILSVVVGLLAIFQFTRNKDRHEYFLSSIAELRKVSWPTLVDTRRMTIIVCVVVGIFAVILSIFDFVWGELLSLILT